MRISYPILFAALAACVTPEQGLDATTLTGTVVVPATELAELDDVANGELPGEDIGLAWGQTFLTGSISTFGDDETRPPTMPDTDLYTLSVEVPSAVSVAVALPDAGIGVEVGVDVYDFTDPSAPALAASTTVLAEGGVVGFAASPGVPYVLAVYGVSGASEQAYELAIDGPHPDDADVLVGAYTSSDPAARGNPVGGTTAGAFELQEDGTYVAPYEMFLIRAVETVETEDGKVTSTVDEDVPEAWIFAGTWSSLNSGQSPGVFFSSTPAHVTLDKDDVAADPVVLDEVVPLAIAQEFADEEPNDMAIDGSFALDVSDPSAAQDIGQVSGPGQVDVITGGITFGAGEGFVHDIDAYAFTVPEPMKMFFELDWDDDTADLDLVLYDASGAYIDFAASTDKPEIGGGQVVLEPELTYYLVIAGYLGPEGGETAYDVVVEQTAP